MKNEKNDKFDGKKPARSPEWKERRSGEDRRQRENARSAESREQRPEELSEGLIEGRNALTEALKSGRAIDKLYVAEGSTDRSLARLAALAKEAGAVVVPTDRRKLDQMSPTGAHQGVIAAVAAHEYASLDDILALAAERGEAPLIVICEIGRAHV